MKNTKTDRIFTADGLRKEFRRIRWPHWFKKETKGDKAIVDTTLSVIGFTVTFAAFFVLCDAVSAGLFKVIGG